MKRLPIIISIILLVLASGCVQAGTTISESMNKIKSLESGDGYRIEYEIGSKTTLNDKLKKYAASDPAALESLTALEALPPAIIRVSASKKGSNQLSVIDMSGLGEILGLSSRSIPMKSISVYSSKTSATFCLRLNEGNKTICTVTNKENMTQEDIIKMSNSMQKFPQQNPLSMVEKINKMHDRGAISFNQISAKVIKIEDKTEACDMISYSVPDIGKLEAGELVAAIGQFNQFSQAIGSAPQLSSLSPLLKTIVKNVSGSICVDKKSGLPLLSDETSEIDLSVMARVGGSNDGKGQSSIPEGSGLLITTSTKAISIKTSLDNSEFEIPKDAVIEEADALDVDIIQ